MSCDLTKEEIYSILCLIDDVMNCNDCIFVICQVSNINKYEKSAVSKLREMLNQ